MRIAVFNHVLNTVELLNVNKKWLKGEMRHRISVWVDDEEWQKLPMNELIEIFLFDFCNYEPSVDYMVDYDDVKHLTHRDFN